MNHYIDLANAIRTHFTLTSIISTLRTRTTFNTSVVLIGSMLSTGVAFLTTTLLVRRMSADDFGLYRLLIDTATTLFPLLLFGLQYTWNLSIATTPSIIEQAKQKGAILLLASGIVVLTILISKLVITPISEVVDIGNYKAFIPFAFIICIPVFRDMTEGVLVSQGKLLASALSILFPQILILGSILLLPSPLRITTVIIIVSVITIISTVSSMFLTRISFKAIKGTAIAILSTNRRIGLPIFLAGIVAVIGRNVIQIYTGIRLSSIEYGYLSLAIMLTGLLSLVPTAIGKAKFKDFATSTKISKQILIGSIVLIAVSAIFLLFISYGYVQLILGNEYGILLQFVPFLLIATYIRGLGDLINRFFFAHGNTAVLTKISLKIGGMSLISGVPLIFVFGVWGVVAVRLLESLLFFSLNSLEYSKF